MGLMKTPEEIANSCVVRSGIDESGIHAVVELHRTTNAIAEAIRAEREKVNKLTAEVVAWRECPHEHFNKVWSQPQMSGLHRSEYMQRIIDARRVVDEAGLLDEWLLKNAW